MSDAYQIRLLGPEEWPLVEPVVRDVFRDALPATPAQGGFLAAFDGSALAGQVQFETLFRIFNLHVAESYRGRGVARLLGEAAARMVPADFSACVLTDEPALVRWAKRYGGRDVGRLHFLRRDY